MNIKPLFHNTILSINNALKEYDDFYISESKCFIQIQLKEFIDRLDNLNKCILNSNVLYHRYLNKEKTDNILTHWKNKKSLMPPVVSIEDDKFMLIDGTHRTNAANLLGSEKIPIAFLGNGIINMKTPLIGECDIIGFR